MDFRSRTSNAFRFRERLIDDSLHSDWPTPSPMSQTEIERKFIEDQDGPNSPAPGPAETIISESTLCNSTIHEPAARFSSHTSRKHASKSKAKAKAGGEKRKRSLSGSDTPSIIPPSPQKQKRSRIKLSLSPTPEVKPSGKVRAARLKDRADSPWPEGVRKLGTYTCSICLSPPKNATITPCGHISCGKCLWESVNSGLETQARAPVPEAEKGARCPVCRAKILGWDGRGGGVRGLKLAVRTVF